MPSPPVIMMAATAVCRTYRNVKVHGTLTSAGCVPEISNGGAADFGEVGLTHFLRCGFIRLGIKMSPDHHMSVCEPAPAGQSKMTAKTQTRAHIKRQVEFHVDNANRKRAQA